MTNYQIGNIVLCHVNFNEGSAAIADATKQDPIFKFEIIGHTKDYKEYFVSLCNNQNINNEFTGSSLTEEVFNTYVTEYSFDKTSLGKNILHCRDKHILRFFICPNCKQEIKERQLFLSTYTGCWC